VFLRCHARKETKSDFARYSDVASWQGETTRSYDQTKRGLMLKQTLKLLLNRLSRRKKCWYITKQGEEGITKEICDPKQR
jgi:hypothetical protein